MVLRFRRISWKFLATILICLNLIFILFIFNILQRECIQDIGERPNDDKWPLPKVYNYFSQKSDYDKVFQARAITVIILEFEVSYNDLAQTILSVCDSLKDVKILIISDKKIYPPLDIGEKFDCNVKLIYTFPSLGTPLNETRPENFLHTEFVLIFPDGVKFPKNEHFKLSHMRRNEIVAFPIMDEFVDFSFECLNIQLNLREWMISYSKNTNNHDDHCEAIVGNFAFIMKTEALLMLNQPFLRPFSNSLYIQAKLNGFTIKIDEDIRFFKNSHFTVNELGKLQLKNLHSLRVKHLYKLFGIKKIVHHNGIELLGCTKKTTRCFDTIIDDKPDYFYLGKWTPPCCLENLRTTARYVFRILERDKVRYWLEGGSALGAARNGDIIPWDFDVDIGIYEEDIKKCELLSLAKEMKMFQDDKGFIWEKAVEGDFIRVQFSSTNRLHVDIFPFYSRNGVMTKNTWFKTHKQDREFSEAFLKPLKKIQFVGWKASVPNNLVKFLEFKFGKGVIENPLYPNMVPNATIIF